MPVLTVVIKSIFLHSLLSILYFPVWWYTSGLKKRFFGFIKGVVNLFRNLSLKLMFTHLFKPMFGERSRSGRIISFFMRLILLIWRSVLFSLGTVGLLLLLIVWIILPVVAVWQIVVLSLGT